jgi:FkbM family methyltransferase
MSTTARRYWLKFLREIGVKHFRTRSGLGLPYICHLGDFSGEVPFYGRRHSAEEILLMAAWCRNIENPVIFDVGANNGFIATQLAQLLRKNSPRIFAFEPVPSTFAQLNTAIEQLDLRSVVVPLCCAVSDSPGVCAISYNPRESLFAQIRSDRLNSRVGSETAFAVTVTIDEIFSSLGVVPSLLKVDVEGFEPRVLRGAAALLSSSEAPAVCFEYNPLTLSELNNSPDEIAQSLPNYRLYYIDDFEGQRKPFGDGIPDLREINWACNVFAVPEGDNQDKKWTVVISEASARLRDHCGSTAVAASAFRTPAGTRSEA